jgi:hypothetical protein
MIRITHIEPSYAGMAKADQLLEDFIKEMHANTIAMMKGLQVDEIDNYGARNAIIWHLGIAFDYMESKNASDNA